MLSIGYSYRVPVGKIVAIVASDSAPIKRMIQHAREAEKLHDCTKGKKTRSAVITSEGEIYLSAFTADSLANRLESAFMMSKVINSGARWIHPHHRSRARA